MTMTVWLDDSGHWSQRRTEAITRATMRVKPDWQAAMAAAQPKWELNSIISAYIALSSRKSDHRHTAGGAGR